MHWVKVEDKIPKFIGVDKVRMLAVFIPENKIPVSFAVYSEVEGFVCFDEGRITHWMYLDTPGE